MAAEIQGFLIIWIKKKTLILKSRDFIDKCKDWLDVLIETDEMGTTVMEMSLNAHERLFKGHVSEINQSEIRSRVQD